MGEQHLQGRTEDGSVASISFQVTGVTRPLYSVGEITDRGNRVVFGKNGGVIQNLRTGKLTPFKRSGGVYELDFYIPEDATTQQQPGFARQGPH